jgi:hypothetical protein
MFLFRFATPEIDSSPKHNHLPDAGWINSRSRNIIRILNLNFFFISTVSLAAKLFLVGFIMFLNFASKPNLPSQFNIISGKMYRYQFAEIIMVNLIVLDHRTAKLSP